MAQATADDHGPVVNVVAWFLLVVTLITVIARTGIKWALTRIMKVDDVIILAASAFAIAQSVAVTRGVIPNGLGRHSIYRTTSQDILFQKFYYASVLLYIPCICLSKLAVLFLLRDVTPVVRHRKIMFNVGALTVAWAIAAESAMAFQCKLPTPWAIFEGHCLDITAFWYCFGVAQLILDMALVTLPWLIVRHLRMTRHRKAVVTCSFGSRLIVIIGVVSQMVFLNNAIKSNDVPFNLWAEFICAQTVQSLSIITACVPHLRPFFDSFETGPIRGDDSRRHGLAYHDTYTPPRSRQPSAPQTWPSDSMGETIELNTRLDELPDRMHNTASGVIPIAFRLSSQQLGRSMQSRQQEAITNHTASLERQQHMKDHEVCHTEIWPKPSKARLLPARV